MMHFFDHLVRHYGYWVITLAIAVECGGLLVPGETVFFGSAIYASSTGRLNIVDVIAAACVGAMIGNLVGYSIGRLLGETLLVRHGARIGLTERRLALGRYLFRRHGGKVVFFGRFCSVLRSFTPLLAGANAMPRRHFAGWTIVGGIAWPVLHGGFAYVLGDAASRMSTGVQILLGIVVLASVVLVLRFLKRNERQLEDMAIRDERARHA
jgi:membrane protein DedA with SNARE-associated domain